MLFDCYHSHNNSFDFCLQGVLFFFFAKMRILPAFPHCSSDPKLQKLQVAIRILPHISIKIRKGPPLRVALGVVSLPRSGHFGGDMTHRLFNNYTIYWGATVKYTRYCTQIYALFLHRFSDWCIYFFHPCEDRCCRVSAAAATAAGGGTGGRKSAARRVPPVTPGPRRSTRQLRRAGRQAAECERGGSPAPAGGTKARGSSRRTGGCGGQAGSAALLRRGARRLRQQPLMPRIP